MASLITAPPVVIDARRLANAQTDLWRFAGLTLQLALLLAVFVVFRVDEGGFLRLAAIAFGAFVVHYWLPLSHKDTWWIAASLVGAVLLLGPQVAGLVVGIGLLFFAVLASPLAYRTRVLILFALGLFLFVSRALEVSWLPWRFWPAFGAVFMFRLFIYLYDLKFAKSGPSLREYCLYFFPLPNFYFLLFPVIDFQTMRRTYYQRDIHAIAQQGIVWMVRGTVQLLLYRLVYHLKPAFTPASVTSFADLVVSMVGVYMLYLRVSGHFHIIVGMMHLFGFDLPETHRKYLLASSLLDFWRRINIYWKDFMVKLVYFPVYFRFRRSGDLRAQVLATAAVFFVTWATHSYQWFWFRGQLLVTWPDTLFWGLLGALVIGNVLLEQRRPKRVAPEHGVVRALKVAGTFSFIVVLWSLWNAPSVSEWLDVITWWRVG